MLKLQRRYIRNGYNRHGGTVSKQPPSPQELLPLTPVVLHILLALADAQGKHGYAVAQEVEALTEGQIRMGPGTLYGSIQRMLASSLIEEASRSRSAMKGRSVQAPADDERRRYYRLTALGRRVLELELARLAHIIAVARRKNLLPELELA
jgi:DNA-binding PadR family transcriptional regulator